MYNLIEYSNNYSKTSGSLWQYYRDDPNDNITQSESFKFKIKITGKTPAAGNTKDVEIAVPLKYLSNLWKTHEMPLTNCAINLVLSWSEDCVISSATEATKFKITDTKLYVAVITLSTQVNEKLLQQLIGTKYQPKASPERQNQCLHFLIDPNFEGVNRLFVLSSENEEDGKVQTGYYLPKVEIKYYNVLNDGKNFFDQPVINDMGTYDKIWKIATGRGDD